MPKFCYDKYMRLVQILFFSILLVASVYIVSNIAVPQRVEPEPLLIIQPLAYGDLPIGGQTAGGQELNNQELNNETFDVPPTSEDSNMDIGRPYIEGGGESVSDIEPPAVIRQSADELSSVVPPSVSVVPVVEMPAVVVQEAIPIINEDEIMQAVVRVRCGKSYGSGFSILRNEKRYVLTAAHVVIDQVEVFKKYQCDVIYPRKDENGNYQEAHYRVGKILLPDETISNYQEKGIDLAVLEVIPLADKKEDLQKFTNSYPYLNYSFCPTITLGDSMNLWGFSANLGTTINPGAFMSKFQGEIVQYEDVIGVTKKVSLEFLNGFVYLPKFDHSLDQGVFHHLTVILSNNNFSGASGGLVFDTNKACIVGVNIATLVQDNKVFGFVTNPEFGPIKEFMNRAIGEL